MSAQAPRFDNRLRANRHRGDTNQGELDLCLRRQETRQLSQGELVLCYGPKKQGNSQYFNLLSTYINNMLHGIQSAGVLFFSFLGFLEGTIINEIPPPDFGSVAKAYHYGKNRLIVVHADGLFPTGESAMEDKRQLENSLSKLAEDERNEICLLSGRGVEAVKEQYSNAKGVRIFGQNGKRLFDPMTGKEYPAQKLPMGDIDGIKDVIAQSFGKHGFKYKVKTGVNPLVIEVAPGQDGAQSIPLRFYALSKVLQEKHGASQTYLRNNLHISVEFKHGNDVVYPMGGVDEGGSAVFDGDGATLSLLPRDFALSIASEAAESSYEIKNKAKSFAATLIAANDKQTGAKIQLADIHQVNAILKQLAGMADKE